MNLSNWVFERFGREHYSPGLERMRFALGEILPQLNQHKIITIAGTNGKGETTLRLANHLQGKRFTAWTSPHVLSLTERFRNQDGLISEIELYKLLESSYDEVLKRDLKLSFYEFLFFVFCRWSVDQDIDLMLLEVGLGGEYDAVNVFDAEVVLLPSISRDHQEFLGNRYDGILKEKLGVLRPHSCLISFLDLDYLNEQIEKKVKEMGIKWINLRPFSQKNFSYRNQLLASVASKSILGVLNPQNLLEDFQYSGLGVENRGEILHIGADYHLYGSHNTDGMRKLIQFLHSGIYNSREFNFNKTIVSFSSRGQSDIAAMMKMLKGSKLLGEVIVTSFSHPKAAKASMLKELSEQEGFEFVENIESRIHSIKNGQVLVAGSYYFISHIRTILGK